MLALAALAIPGCYETAYVPNSPGYAYAPQRTVYVAPPRTVYVMPPRTVYVMPPRTVYVTPRPGRDDRRND
jgi:hypothetical protein